MFESKYHKIKTFDYVTLDFGDRQLTVCVKRLDNWLLFKSIDKLPRKIVKVYYFK